VKFISFLTLFLVSGFTSAQDHLYPEDSVYGAGIHSLDYHLYVKKAFSAAYFKDVILRVIEIPSFSPESALFIKKINDSYKVLYIEAETHYWSSNREELKSNPITKCVISIDNSIVVKIEKIWLSELLKTRYPIKNDFGLLDGTSYHFSTPIKWGKKTNNQIPIIEKDSMSGVAKLSNGDSRMSALVDLVSTLKGFCLNKNTKVNIQKLTDRLTY